MKKCPLIKKKCIGAECAWSETVVGNNPNTGEPIHQTGCVITFIPLLLIENSKQQQSTSSAIESARNILAGAINGTNPEIQS